jgi:hypothetical protein
MDELLKLLIGDMSRLVPLPELLEVIERNKRGANLVGNPVVLNNPVEFVQIDIIRALVERFRYCLHDQNVIERSRIV